MDIRKFVQLDKDEMLKYIKDKLVSTDYLFDQLSFDDVNLESMLEIKIPKVNIHRKLIKKREASYGCLYDIKVGRSLDLYFLNSDGDDIGCYWFYGNEGVFKAIVDSKERTRETVCNILQMSEVYDTCRRLS